MTLLAFAGTGPDRTNPRFTPAPSSNSRMLEASVQDDARLWQDAEIGVLQGLVAMRYRLAPDVINTMVAAFRKHAPASSGSLKFGTLVYTTVTKYGDEVCAHWRQELFRREYGNE